MPHMYTHKHTGSSLFTDCICKFAYALKFICDTCINTSVFSRSFIFFVDYLCGHSYYLYKSSTNVIYPTTHSPSRGRARPPGTSSHTGNKYSTHSSFSATRFAFLCFFLAICCYGPQA